jgi:hypothetical protein
VQVVELLRVAAGVAVAVLLAWLVLCLARPRR